MSNLQISVVIPTYNRADLLRYTLESLVLQTLDKQLFEVIVVDDGSTDTSEQLVQSFAERLNIKYFWQEDKGFRAGKARNIGVSIAEGKYIVFIDTGVLLGSKTLEVHANVHSQSEFPVVIIGYVYGFEVDNSLLAEMSAQIDSHTPDATILRLAEMGAHDVRQLQYDELGENISNWPAPFDIFWTCHASAEREQLLKAGLFDESFNSWGGEDVDLGVRLHLNNNQFVMEKDAVSFHWPHKKEVDDQKIQSEIAAIRIHKKYQLWSTSFYGKDLNDAKYSLNKVIKIHRDHTVQKSKRALALETEGA
ncbi:glycosyltransferase [Iodobacter fluviatilis]|jgi:glycosyltransferase involved in cell wall biosynthesis|uniref:Glycosyl transferase n=1 Tax=Iodobacter fluviatilis TaxID=537 RepID=A0A7G3G8U2_9NEIS|nr:glycosyltransferase [Iodobacter fluviatilis]QBC43453.1 glycosyl transferase [Iodobacter fluviatilis]